MKKLVLTIMILIAAVNPALAYNKHSARTKCIFSAMMHHKSCRQGFGLENGAVSVTDKWLYPLISLFSKSKEGVKAREILVDVIEGVEPSHIYFEMSVGGSGLRVGYLTEGKVKNIQDRLDHHGGKFSWDMMYDIIPDEMWVTIGVELAFITTAKVGTILIFKNERQIRAVVQGIKQAVNKNGWKLN